VPPLIEVNRGIGLPECFYQKISQSENAKMTISTDLTRKLSYEPSNQLKNHETYISSNSFKPW
jgi:hypothetical protein